MAYIELKVRKLDIRELRDMKTTIRKLRRLDRLRNPPSVAYRHLLANMLQGDFHSAEDVPPWTSFFWIDDDESDRLTEVVRDFDRMISNCDLARLAYFARTGEGQTVRKFLKNSFARVTLATESSLYSFFADDVSALCIPVESIEIV